MKPENPWNDIFHSLVCDWFVGAFNKPTAVQIQAWKAISENQDVLISSPTGSGKTLAAFLYALNTLFSEQDNKLLSVLYISPLKALSNDVKINLEKPLAQLNQLFGNKNIRAATWTGDTTPNERNKIRKKPPHILVTTPESLYTLLTAHSGRTILGSIKTVIIDEIHAVANSKRGAHLSLSLQRLEALCVQRPQRIAISATQKPIEKMRDFVLHKENSAIVNLGHKRELDLSIEIPESPLNAIMSNEQWSEVYKRLKQVINSHTTTLIFVNNRRLSERVAKNLAEIIGDEFITSHHGSLAKEHRLKAEQDLKAGNLKALVATASLELGIDIGDIDCVCQIGTPGNIQAFLQRVGRSGHSLDKTPKGLLFATTIDDLLELTALKYAITNEQLDSTLFPVKPMDVLSQQIVAEIAMQDWDRKQLFHLLTDNYIYQNLSEKEFNQVIDMLAHGYGGNRQRQTAMIFHDKVTDQLRPRKVARLTAITNGGTIPDQFDYDVRLLPEDIKIGTLNEDFSFDSIPGDIFILGNHSYRILKVETRKGVVFVEDAQGQPPNVPFWFGVTMWRSDELSKAVSDLTVDLSQEEHVSSKYKISDMAAEQLMNYVAKSNKVLGVIPSQKHIVVERFFDENNDMHLVIHSLFGSRLNRAWGLALRKKFCTNFNFELQAAADENSLILSLSESHSFDLTTVINYLNPETVEYTLIQALLDRPMFETQWRWNATVALAIRRRNGGKRVPAQFQRNNAEDLIAQLFPDQIACPENLGGDREIPDHPLVHQAVHDCIRVLMDIDGLAQLLRDIKDNKVKVTCVDANTPSPASLAIINARNFAFLDDAPAEERRTRALQTKELSDTLESFPSQNLDKNIIKSINTNVNPFKRDADELHEAIFFAGFLTEDEIGEAAQWLPELKKQKKVSVIAQKKGLRNIWFSSENKDLIECIYKKPDDNYTINLAKLTFMKLETLGFTSFELLKDILCVSASSLLQALMLLENQGKVFKIIGEDKKEYWCERHILARIRKQTHYKKRNSHQLISPQTYQQKLLNKHFSQHESMDGLIEVLKLLEGFSAPASIWEEHLLKPRVKNYQSYMLDQLCYSGQFIFKRITPNTQISTNGIATIKNTPITFIQRNNVELFATIDYLPEQLTHQGQKIIELIGDNGAMYASDMQKQLDCMLLEIENTLIHLVKLGVIYCDGASALRLFSMSPAQRGRYIKKSNSKTSYLDMMGRWSVAPKVEKTDNKTIVKILLNRYGILFKALFDKEQLPLKWYDCVYELTRLEAQGEILAGRFVKSYSGIQFADKSFIKQKDLMGNVKIQLHEKDCCYSCG
ncbi:MAG: DEAD/DEAH box helicase [Marinicellaceae bacterium]